jgi:hypothetical protein
MPLLLSLVPLYDQGTMLESKRYLHFSRIPSSLDAKIPKICKLHRLMAAKSHVEYRMLLPFGPQSRTQTWTRSAADIKVEADVLVKKRSNEVQYIAFSQPIK